MHVTGPGTKLLFCEGTPDSYDYGLLDSMLIGRPPTVVLVPLGGKHGIRAFVQGRLSAYRARPDYLVFRDRDFDAEPPADVRLIALAADRPIWLSYRTAIENYLLDPALIHRYWEGSYRTGPSWSYGDSPGQDDLRTWMDGAASEIACYQAVRWALASLKPTDRWPEVNTTWTEGSGDLPTSLAEDECLSQAKRLVSDFCGQVGQVSEARLLESYERFSEQFSSPHFAQRDDYLVWFHGKDLMKAMQRRRQNAISMGSYCGWAVKRLDWTQYADLRELSGKI